MPRTLMHPVRPGRAHRPELAGDGTPGVCYCGLPMTRRNVLHQVDEDALAELDAVHRARYGDRD